MATSSFQLIPPESSMNFEMLKNKISKLDIERLPHDAKEPIFDSVTYSNLHGFITDINKLYEIYFLPGRVSKLLLCRAVRQNPIILELFKTREHLFPIFTEEYECAVDARERLSFWVAITKKDNKFMVDAYYYYNNLFELYHCFLASTDYFYSHLINSKKSRDFRYYSIKDFKKINYDFLLKVLAGISLLAPHEQNLENFIKLFFKYDDRVSDQKDMKTNININKADLIPFSNIINIPDFNWLLIPFIPFAKELSKEIINQIKNDPIKNLDAFLREKPNLIKFLFSCSNFYADLLTCVQLETQEIRIQTLAKEMLREYYKDLSLRALTQGSMLAIFSIYYQETLKPRFAHPTGYFLCEKNKSPFNKMICSEILFNFRKDGLAYLIETFKSYSDIIIGLLQRNVFGFYEALLNSALDDAERQVIKQLCRKYSPRHFSDPLPLDKALFIYDDPGFILRVAHNIRQCIDPSAGELKLPFRKPAIVSRVFTDGAGDFINATKIAKHFKRLHPELDGIEVIVIVDKLGERKDFLQKIGSSDVSYTFFDFYQNNSAEMIELFKTKKIDAVIEVSLRTMNSGKNLQSWLQDAGIHLKYYAFWGEASTPGIGRLEGSLYRGLSSNQHCPEPSSFRIGGELGITFDLDLMNLKKRLSTLSFESKVNELKDPKLKEILAMGGFANSSMHMGYLRHPTSLLLYCVMLANIYKNTSHTINVFIKNSFKNPGLIPYIKKLQLFSNVSFYTPLLEENKKTYICSLKKLENRLGKDTRPQLHLIDTPISDEDCAVMRVSSDIVAGCGDQGYFAALSLLGTGIIPFLELLPFDTVFYRFLVYLAKEYFSVDSLIYKYFSLCLEATKRLDEVTEPEAKEVNWEDFSLNLLMQYADELSHLVIGDNAGQFQKESEQFRRILEENHNMLTNIQCLSQWLNKELRAIVPPYSEKLTDVSYGQHSDAPDKFYIYVPEKMLAGIQNIPLYLNKKIAQYYFDNKRPGESLNCWKKSKGGYYTQLILTGGEDFPGENIFRAFACAIALKHELNDAFNRVFGLDSKTLTLTIDEKVATTTMAIPTSTIFSSSLSSNNPRRRFKLPEWTRLLAAWIEPQTEAYAIETEVKLSIEESAKKTSAAETAVLHFVLAYPADRQLPMIYRKSDGTSISITEHAKPGSELYKELQKRNFISAKSQIKK